MTPTLLIWALEVEANADLAFAAGQVLQGGSRSRSCTFESFHRGWIGVIEKFEKDLSGKAFANNETLGNAQVHIDEGRCGLRIPCVIFMPKASPVDTLAIEETVSVEVGSILGAYGPVESALCPENWSQLELPR